MRLAGEAVCHGSVPSSRSLSSPNDYSLCRGGGEDLKSQGRHRGRDATPEITGSSISCHHCHPAYQKPGCRIKDY